jgi:hypothetical protein
MNRMDTPGPPWKEASPMVEKMPAPITAAIPIAVRSFTFNTLCRDPVPCASVNPSLASLSIVDNDFLRNNDLDKASSILVICEYNEIYDVRS